jgi:hypothetical protein
MKSIKLCDSETFESTRTVDLSRGPVKICEREVHDFYRPEESQTRLVISDAIDRTRTFISKPARIFRN